MDIVPLSLTRSLARSLAVRAPLCPRQVMLKKRAERIINTTE